MLKFHIISGNFTVNSDKGKQDTINISAHIFQLKKKSKMIT